MAKTILVAGYGPGISSAVAERFGQAGFQVALVARNPERLTAGVKSLEARGIRARGFPADLGVPEQAASVVGRVRSDLGPLDALVWVAYSGGAGDLFAADAAELRGTLELSTTSLVTVVKEALPDLRARKGAVLVTNGGLGLYDEKVDAMAAQGVMGLAIANAAKHKLVGVLSHRLRGEGIYVGEVMVLGMVKGTAFDRGAATVEPATVAERFWDVYTARSPTFSQMG